MYKLVANYLVLLLSSGGQSTQELHMYFYHCDLLALSSFLNLTCMATGDGARASAQGGRALGPPMGLVFRNVDE
jgi:hypothetical protein